jgi:predicted PurR-regulated permease PerM
MAEPALKPPAPVPEPPPASVVPEPSPVAIEVPVQIRNIALTALAVIAVIFFLQYSQPVLIPVILGVLISYAADPAVTALEKKIHVPRALGAALVLLALCGAGAALLYELEGQGEAILEQMPGAAARLRRIVEQDRPRKAAIQQVQKAATELEKAADAATNAPDARPDVQKVEIQSPPLNVGQYVVWGSVGAAAVVGQLIMILFLAFFLLASGDLYRRKIVKIAGPSLSKKKITLQILQDIDHQIEWFLIVQVFTSAVVGVATWIAFRSIGLQQAGFWGLMAGVFNSIPYLGPVVVSGGTAVVAFLQFGSLRMVVIASVLAMAITSAEGMLLTPWLTSRAARMNAVAIFIGLLFWGWVWSIWGMLLAVPMLMVLKAICDHVEDLKEVGELLGE